jgi:L-asparagine transporter-like permease
VALNYTVPERVFVYVTSISLVGSLWTWALIIIAHLGYRKAWMKALGWLFMSLPFGSLGIGYHTASITD